jgi:acetyltransferase-like isoleucine patch superfamily enzyme
VKILGTNVYSGMIKIGCNFVRQYPNTGFVYENFGRELIFKGKCNIGNNSAIFLSKKAKICFGENFNASTTLKIGAYKNIDFGNDVLCGWNCQFLDSDIHQLKRTNSTPDPVAIKSIHIGNNVWFAMNNIVLKGTILPDNIVVASNSLLNKNYDIPSNCLLAGIPAKVKVKNIVRIPGNDEIRIN